MAQAQRVRGSANTIATRTSRNPRSERSLRRFIERVVRALLEARPKPASDAPRKRKEPFVEVLTLRDAPVPETVTSDDPHDRWFRKV